MGDPANRATIPSNDILGNGERLNGDSQLRHWSNCGLVTPQQDGMERGKSNEGLETPVRLTIVLVPTDEPYILMNS